MGAGFGRIGRFCLFLARPLRSAEAAHGWINLIPGTAIVGGLIAGAIAGIVGSPTAFVVYALVVLILVLCWGAWRLFVRVEELEAPPPRPANWEALIRTSRRWEVAAAKVSRNHYITHVLRQERPGETFRPDPGGSREYDDALQDFQTEVAIAGKTLPNVLMLEIVRAQFEISACRYDLSDHDETKCRHFRSMASESVKRFAEQISD